MITRLIEKSFIYYLYFLDIFKSYKLSRQFIHLALRSPCHTSELKKVSLNKTFLLLVWLNTVLYFAGSI